MSAATRYTTTSRSITHVWSGTSVSALQLLGPFVNARKLSGTSSRPDPPLSPSLSLAFFLFFCLFLSSSIFFSHFLFFLFLFFFWLAALAIFYLVLKFLKLLPRPRLDRGEKQNVPVRILHTCVTGTNYYIREHDRVFSISRALRSELWSMKETLREKSVAVLFCSHVQSVLNMPHNSYIVLPFWTVTPIWLLNIHVCRTLVLR